VKAVFAEVDIQAALSTGEVAHLGTGSFGETWSAPFGTTTVAYKIIYVPGYSPDRLQREIAGYERVSSRHVVALHEVRTIAIAGTDYVTMIFDFVNGGDLEANLRLRRPTDTELEALAVGLLRGIAAMHSAGVIHRDIKPANVALMDSRFDWPVILDLGLARLVDVESITNYPAGVGSAPYMAPEQVRGERALRASDLWAVGVVLYEAATGGHPFLRAGERVSYADLLSRLATPPSLPAGVSQRIGELIHRCLSDPPHRRGTVAKALSRMEGSAS
jgi:serine/threonine protein kinase